MFEKLILGQLALKPLYDHAILSEKEYLLYNLNILYNTNCIDDEIAIYQERILRKNYGN